MKKKSLEAIQRYSTSNDLAAFVILLVLLTLVMARLFFRNRFDEFLGLFGSGTFFIIKSREHKSLFGFNVLMLFAHILCVSLFLFITYRFFGQAPEDTAILFVRLATGYGFFILVKSTLEKIIANIFELDEVTDFYLFQKHSYRNLVSLIFLPAAVILIYTIPPTAKIIYIIFGIFAVFLLAGFFQVVKKNQGLITRYWFYFILYLCALEIAPYLILYKLITAGKVT